MGALRPWHILIVLLIVLLLFGARRLPDLARSVGQSLKVFKDEVKDLTDDGNANAPAPAAEPATFNAPPAPLADTPTPPSAPGDPRTTSA